MLLVQCLGVILIDFRLLRTILLVKWLIVSEEGIYLSSIGIENKKGGNRE